MNNRFFYMASRFNYALKMQIKKAFKKSGINLTNSQIGLLLVLEKGKSITMSSLSDILKTDNGATFRLVEILVKSGHVRREQNPADLRQQLVFITDSGLDVTSSAKKVVKKANQKLKDLFSEEEVNTFNLVLAKLVDELEKDNFF